MSSSDSRMFEELVARVERLERRVNDITERILPKDASGDLYGEEVDHTADRAERAEIGRRVPRPPGGGR